MEITFEPPFIKAFYVILGSITSVFISAIIKISLNRRDRHREMERLEKDGGVAKYGNLEQYINTNNKDLHLVDFFHELTLVALRPLIILSLVNLFEYKDNNGVIFSIFIIGLSYAHEIYFGMKWADKGWYRLLLFSLWVIFFFIQVNKFSELLIHTIDTP